MNVQWNAVQELFARQRRARWRRAIWIPLLLLHLAACVVLAITANGNFTPFAIVSALLAANVIAYFIVDEIDHKKREWLSDFAGRN